MTFRIIARRTFIFKTKAVPVEIEIETIPDTTLTAAMKILNERYPLYKGMNYEYYYYTKDSDGGRWKISLESDSKQ